MILRKSCALHEFFDEKLVDPVASSTLVLMVLCDSNQVVFPIHAETQIISNGAHQFLPVHEARRHGQSGAGEHSSILIPQRVRKGDYQLIELFVACVRFGSHPFPRSRNYRADFTRQARPHNRLRDAAPHGPSVHDTESGLSRRPAPDGDHSSASTLALT